jgi:hypothetical protein
MNNLNFKQTSGFSDEDYMQTATMNCRQEKVLNWWLGSHAFKVVALGKDEFMLIEYEPIKDDLIIETKLYTEEQILQKLQNSYAINIKKPEIKLFFKNSIK